MKITAQWFKTYWIGADKVSYYWIHKKEFENKTNYQRWVVSQNISTMLLSYSVDCPRWMGESEYIFSLPD